MRPSKPLSAPGVGTLPLAAVFLRAAAALAVALTDGAAIVAASVGAGVLYHLAIYGDVGRLPDYTAIGLVAAMLFVVPGVWRGDYATRAGMELRAQLKEAFRLWNSVALCLLVLGFATKMTDAYSRGALILFYLLTLPMIAGGRVLARETIRLGQRYGLSAARRILVVGQQRDIEAFLARIDPALSGLRIAGVAELHRDTLADDLAAARALARRLKPEAIFVAATQSDQDAATACLEALRVLPAELHLTLDATFDRFGGLRIARAGDIASLQLARAPQSIAGRMAKRGVDIAVASLALLLAAPVLLLAAILIRLDSPGPVLFRQRRYGFNQEPFHIYKLRTMTVTEDGETVRQASSGDARITRIGAVLRRWNIDELPQLLNVLKGDMSLVGPRPHALVHDRAFEQSIALYARRSNVKPGITGWAQVNGFRGPTDTLDKIEGRVRHDLHYIDNWSLLFDLKIMLLTVFSRKAYANAL